MAICRHCPTCKAALPPGSGVQFDQKHNVLCAYCGGVVFPAEISKEPEKKVVHTAAAFPQYAGGMGFYQHGEYPNAIDYTGGE